jgi:5'-phosphate synthase pdxT subunit
MKIGVLALQGDFSEHQAMLENLACEVVQVRLPVHLEGLDGLIIPGGESTTIGKLATAYHLMKPLMAFGKNHAMWGTCAGAIFLSNDIHRDQPLLKLMDITTERNAFGRQVDSFELDLDVPALTEVSKKKAPFHAVFIRAPLIESVGKDVQVLAALDSGRIVAARQGRLLASSFHPELTGDDRFHRYFLELAK